jgi:DNA primase
MDNYVAARSVSFATLAGALGIELTHFKRSKDEWVGPCPRHKPKNNKACFRYKDDGLFNCFVCLKDFCGRGSIDFYKAYTGAGFQAAVEFLTPLGISTPAQQKTAPERDSEATEEPKPFTGKYAKHFVENDWLKKRLPDAAVRERYGIGFYSNPARKSKVSNHVLIPIKDPAGVQYGWLARNPVPLEGQPKYIWPTGLPKNRFLFGGYELSQAYQLPVRVVYLVESPLCVMKFASMSLPAVSPFGWNVSDEQLHLLSTLAKGTVYLPDRNKHCEGACVAARLSAQVWCRFPELPQGHDDPEHLSLEQIQALTR